MIDVLSRFSDEQAEDLTLPSQTDLFQRVHDTRTDITFDIRQLNPDHSGLPVVVEAGLGTEIDRESGWSYYATMAREMGLRTIVMTANTQPKNLDEWAGAFARTLEKVEDGPVLGSGNSIGGRRIAAGAKKSGGQFERIAIVSPAGSRGEVIKGLPGVPRLVQDLFRKADEDGDEFQSPMQQFARGEWSDRRSYTGRIWNGIRQGFPPTIADDLIALAGITHVSIMYGQYDPIINEAILQGAVERMNEISLGSAELGAVTGVKHLWKGSERVWQAREQARMLTNPDYHLPPLQSIYSQTIHLGRAGVMSYSNSGLSIAR